MGYTEWDFSWTTPHYAFLLHTQTHPPSFLLWHRQSSPAWWQWWMQNMKHINAADSGQCQAFLHCVKLNKQDQAKVNGNWPSRDKALAMEVEGVGYLYFFRNFRWTKRMYSTIQMVTFIYEAIGFSSSLQRWIITRRRHVLYYFSVQHFISNRLSL